MQRGARGFTLLELMVTLAIVAILGVLTVPVVEVSVQREKEQQLRVALREIREALDAYKRAGEGGLIDVLPDASGYPVTLDLLVDGVPRREDYKNKKITKIYKVYFLRRVPRDPFNEQAGLAPSATWGQRSYASEPGEPREGVDIFDVYSLSRKVGLNGIPYTSW
jgi:general secretion pathway protein G